MKRIALLHTADMDLCMSEVAAMKRALESLAACCQGDDRHDCPIRRELFERGARAQGSMVSEVEVLESTA